MQKISLMFVVLGVAFAAPFAALAKVNVFACEPEWASLAEEIGGDDVEAFAATHAQQDPHHIRARPSLIAKMRKADVLVCSGASLEIGWLPILLEKAGNRQVQMGAAGSLMAADVVPMLEVPTVLDRSDGDVHPEGNPHVHLNPHNVQKVAEALTERLVAVDAAHADAYRARLADFTTRWQKAMSNWKAEAAPLKGKGFIPHHRNWSYLADWLELKEVATLEPKPGLPPTTGHLQQVLQQVKADRPAFIIRSPYANSEGAEWLEGKTGLPSLVLPYTVGGDAESTNLFSLYDRTLHLMLEAAQ